jgi:glycosyltransferase 2 family protein
MPDLSEPPAAQPEPRRKRKWGLLLLAAALVFLIVRQLRTEEGFDWGLLAATMAGADRTWLAVSCLLSLASYYGRALRWAAMLRPARPHPSSWRIFEATAMGFTAIVLLGSPGEIVRPYLIGRGEGTPFSVQLGIWFLERIYDTLAVLLMLGVGLAFLPASAAGAGPALGWAMRNGGYLIASLALVCLVLLVVIRRYTEAMRRRFHDALEALPAGSRDRVRHVFDAFVAGVAATRDNRVLLETVLLTVLEWALLAATYYTLFLSFGGTIRFGWLDVVIFMGFLAFAGAVQLPGVGGGVQVVSVLVLTELFGVSLEAAAGMGLLVWLVSFLVIAPPGLLFAARAGLNLASMKELRRQAAAEESLS